MPASHTNVPFVDAYDTETGEKVSVPPHFLEKGSPFPNLSKTPSAKSAEKQSSGQSGATTKEK